MPLCFGIPYSHIVTGAMTSKLLIGLTLCLWVGPSYGFIPGGLSPSFGTSSIQLPKEVTAPTNDDLVSLINLMTERLDVIKQTIASASCECAASSGPKPTEAEMSSLDTDVSGLSTIHSEKHDVVLNIGAGLNTVKAAVDGIILQEDVDDLKAGIQTLQTDVGGLETPVPASGTFDEQVEQAVADRDSLDSDIQGSIDSINTCKAQCSSSPSLSDVSAFKSKISDLKLQTDELMAFRDANIGIVETVSDSVNGIEVSRSSLETQTAALHAKVDDFVNDVNILATQKEGLQTTSSQLLTLSSLGEMTNDLDDINTQGQTFIDQMSTALLSAQDELNAIQQSQGDKLASLNEDVDTVEQKFQSLGVVEMDNELSMKIAEVRSFSEAATTVRGNVEKAHQLAELYDGINTVRYDIEVSLDSIDQVTSDLADFISGLDDKISALDKKYGASCVEPFTYDPNGPLCYFLNTAQLDWWSAHQTCQMIGGIRARLVKVDTEEKLAVLSNAITTKDGYWANYDYYVGWFTYQEFTNTYMYDHMMWLDGTIVDQSNYYEYIWGYGQPSDVYNTKCGGLYQRQLDDMDCDWYIRSICEIPTELL